MNYYSTESSVVYRLNSSKDQPYWAEAHVHFGRYNVVHISASVSSDSATPKDSLEFIEQFLFEIEYKLADHFGHLTNGFDIEILVTVFFFGFRIALGPCHWGDTFSNVPVQVKNSLQQKINEQSIGMKP